MKRGVAPRALWPRVKRAWLRAAARQLARLLFCSSPDPCAARTPPPPPFCVCSAR